MSDIVILARVQLNELDYLTVDDYTTSARERLADVDGFIGMGVWQRRNDPMAIMIVYQYRDLESAERGLVALTGIRLLAEQQSADYRPADVLRVRLKDQEGCRMHEVPRGAFLSLSNRYADPGFGDDLAEEIDRIFDELRLMPGYLGSLHGHNDTLAEEVVGIALWQNEQAFAASIPPTVRNYEVQLYRRIG